MRKMIPIAVPEELATVLRYRRMQTGMPITKQLEQMIFGTVSPEEIKTATTHSKKVSKCQT